MSDKVHDLTGLERTIDQLNQAAARGFKGGGGGDDGMMERLAIVETKLTGVEGRMDRLETRMDRLEGRMDGIDGRLRGVETGLATLTERVAHLPSKGFMVTGFILALTVMTGLITFADKLQSLVGP